MKSDYQYNYKQWSEYLGGPDRNHYSELDQITKANVKQLEIAWTYTTPDIGQMQMNPIIIDTILYGISAGLKVFALNAESGKEVWLYGDSKNARHNTSRGVSYWTDGKDKRIFFTKDSMLIALNALNGKPVESFGDKGKVDLHKGLPASAKGKYIASTTPGTIFEDLIIMPVRVSEGSDAAPGNLRAFNVRTGELVWTFHTIPHPGELGYETWENEKAYQNTEVGGVNNWAGMAVDKRSGILFVPLGSAAPDFYGGRRLGDNLFANCLLALNARTGERIWHFQTVHHDLWDRDLPAPPNLIKVMREGKEIEAVAQVTKQGYVFVFERTTGKPLFEIEESIVPPSTLDGEVASKTQPIPVLPRPFARQINELSTDDINPYSKNRKELLEKLKSYNKTLLQPPGINKPNLLLPGYDGGAEWGGAAADPDQGILYVNSNEMAWELLLEPTTNNKYNSSGKALYISNCAACHQKDFTGLPQSGIPSLAKMQEIASRSGMYEVISNGKGMMPGFPQLTKHQKNAILDYLLGLEKQEILATPQAETKVPYRHTGYKKFLDSDGLPAISPPWGTLHAIDLNSGTYKWSIPLGITESIDALGHPPTGTENYGGPLVTENGLLFIAATKDGYIRAFDKDNGKMLWKKKLPAPAFATPAMYSVNGKQFVVVACGGEKLGTVKGNKVVAFALP